MRRSSLTAAGVALAVAAYGTLDAFDKVPGVLTIDHDPSAPAIARTVQPSDSAAGGAGGSGSSPGSSPSAVAPQPPVVDPSAAALPAARTSGVTTAGLARALGGPLADPALGPSVGLVVRTGAGGAVYGKGEGVEHTPASSLKLLTASVVVDTLGADTRLPTTVVRSAPAAGTGGATATPTLTLVAGGDTLLGTGASAPGRIAGHAGLQTLADQVAKALGTTKRVTLAVDTSLAAGPDYAPTWDPGFLAEGIVGKVAPIGLGTDLVAVGTPGVSDPVDRASEAFVAALARRGVTVIGEVRRATAPAGATTVGSVESAPVADQLAVALQRSDNALTEALARLAYRRVTPAPGRATSFAEVATWVRGRLAAQSYDLADARMADVCGLSPGSRVSARLLADALVRGSTGASPGLARVVADLPVAGLSGTLAERFVSGGSVAAAGVARAKTGTLTGVSSLAGTVVTADGELLVYALLADQVPSATGTLAARTALDDVVATLARCGCRG